MTNQEGVDGWYPHEGERGERTGAGAGGMDMCDGWP